MAKRSQKLIARHGTTQFRARKAAAGNDQLVAENYFFCTFHPEAFAGFLHLFHFKSGQKPDIGLFQSKTQHIHHGICLVGIGIHPAGILRHGVKPQLCKPRKGVIHVEGLQCGCSKRSILSVVAALHSMEVCQIAAAVARCCKFAANSGLALHQDHLVILVFRRGNGGSHAGCTGADDADHHKNHLLSFLA